MDIDSDGSATVVKSAGRVFEVLELFRRNRRQMTAGEIGQALGYPKSSTNALIKSLLSLGYLVIDTASLRYLPSLAVTQLGDWIPALVLGSSRGFQILEEINAATQETVTLSVQADLSCRLVRVASGTLPISLHIEEGLTIPLLTTAVGEAIMMQLADEQILEICERDNGGADAGRRRVDPRRIVRAVRDARKRGYSIEYEAVFPDTAAIAVPFPSEIEGFPMAICVAGLRGRIRRNERKIYRAIRASITQFGKTSGPRRPPVLRQV